MAPPSGSQVEHCDRYSSASRSLRLVDFQFTAAEDRAIQRLHGAHGVGTRHLDEAESLRRAGSSIRHELKRFDGSVRRKGAAHRIFGGGERQIANIEFGQFKYSRV